MPSIDELFADCDTMAEVYVTVAALTGGTEAVRELLSMTGDTKERLKEAAGELKRVGLADPAAVVAAASRHARRGPPTFSSRLLARQRRLLAEARRATR